VTMPTAHQHPAITPLSPQEAQTLFADALVEVGPNGQPVSDDATPQTPAASAAPTAPEPAPAPATELSPAAQRIESGNFGVGDVDTLRDELVSQGMPVSDAAYRKLRAAGELQDAQREELATYLEQQHARLEARVPEVSRVADPESRREAKDTLTEYVGQFDFQPQELYSVTDSRAIELAAHGLKQTQRVRELERELAQFRAGTHPTQRDETEQSARTPRTRKPAPRVAPDELRPMGMHEARRLMERFISDND